jgi:uncharacterized membrane protein YeaQ/YmgE (transglycosylase-associated protein family)
MVGTILWALIGGTVIGILGKTFAPGDRDIALWLTVLCGVGGVFLGNFLYIDVFNFQENTARIDWWRHIWQVAVAAILVVIVTSGAGRKKKKTEA